MADSFDLLRAGYIRSQGLNHTFIPGFASHMHSSVLRHIPMEYCFQSQDMSCDKQSRLTMVCKIPCK